MVDIVSLLSTDGYIMCNKTLIRLYGGDCAILVGELCAEYNYYNANGMLETDFSFYSTQENIEKNTGLNPHYQRKAFKILQEAEIIKITKKGLPAKNYYKINKDKLCEIFTASSSSGEGLDVEDLNINNNKQKTINNKVISKDITTSSENEDFSFGIETDIQDKPKKKNLYQKCLDVIYEYTDLEDIRNALINYLNFRLEIKDKPLYVNQFKGMLKALDKAVEDTYAYNKNITYVDVIQYAITRGYLNFYPVPNTSYSGTKSINPDTNKCTQKKFNPDTDKLSNMTF